MYHTLTLINLYQERSVTKRDRGKKEGVERRVGVNCECLRKRGGINERGGGIQGDGTGPLKIGRV